MPYPSSAGIVIIWGAWYDEYTRGGMDATLTATPLLPSNSTATGTPNLTEAASWSWIKARTWTTKPLASGLYAFPLIANDDPDLTAFGGYRIDAQGEQPFIINVTATAPTITVTNELADALAQTAALSNSTLSIPVGSTVQAIHLTDAAVLSQPAPQPPSAYYTMSQTNSVIAAAVASAGGGGGSSLVPTTIYTTNSHVPVNGEFARYNPSSNLTISLPPAAASQRFGVANVSTGSSTLTFNRQGSDTFSDGSTSLVLAPGERAVLIGASGGFTIESRTVLSGGSQFTQSATKTAAYTAAANEIAVLDTSGGTFTLTGPTSGKPFGARWRAGTAAPVIAAPAGYTINGAASITMGLAPSSSAGELVTWQAFGTDYQTVGGFKPQTALAQVARSWPAGGNRIVADGESTTLGNVNASATVQSLTYCWPLYAQLMSGSRVNIARIAAIGGTTIQQAIDRFDTAVTPYAPTTVVLTSGTNDIFNSTPFDTYKAAIATYHAKVRAIGARLVIGTIPPNNSGTYQPSIFRWNTWLRRYAQLNGLTVIDFHALLTDPATGGFIAAANTGDGTHPAESGYQLMGQLAARVLAPQLPVWGPSLTAAQNDAANSLAGNSNAVWLTDTDADGIPDGWTGSGPTTGFTHSLVTDPEVAGRLMRIAVAASTTGSRIVTRSLFPPGSFAVGDRLAVSGVVTTSGIGVRARVKAQFNSTGGQSLIPAEFCGAVTRGVFHQEAVVPAGCTQIDISVQAEPGATTAGGTVDFGQLTVHNLTALAAA